MGFLSQTQPPEGPIRWQKDLTTAHVEKQDLSQGTLYIAESHVCWVNSSGQGFSVPYPAITVHAISKDLAAFPHECLYLMIDSDVMSELRDVPGQAGDGVGNHDSNNSDDGYEEEEGTEIREIRFIPQDKSSLQSMFDAMSQCQALHPDPEDAESPDENYGQGDYEEEEENGEDVLEEMGEGDSESMDTGQFDDADH